MLGIHPKPKLKTEILNMNMRIEIQGEYQKKNQVKAKAFVHDRDTQYRLYFTYWKSKWICVTVKEPINYDIRNDFWFVIDRCYCIKTLYYSELWLCYSWFVSCRKQTQRNYLFHRFPLMSLSYIFKWWCYNSIELISIEFRYKQQKSALIELFSYF